MNIQMKQRYILPALLLLCSACQQEEWAQPEADGPDAIRFAAPTITVEKLTRSTFHDVFPTNGTFGVLGYCVPYLRGSDTEKDWASGSANWGNKSDNAFPDVFFNQAVTYDGSACTYSYNNGGLRKWYNTKDDPNATAPDDYRYTFFAYYPKDNFKVESPADALKRGVPKLTFTMPFPADANVDNLLDDTKTPDAMVSVVYNHLRTTGNVGFNFSHIMTGLGFAVNNYNYGDEKEETVTVKSVTLSGNFTRSITIDFSKSTNEAGFYVYNGTYSGTYAIYNDDNGYVVPPNSSVSPIGKKHLLLLSNATDDTYFGTDVKVHVKYTYKGQEKSATAKRPSQFQPRAGVRYTAQLNFVGETFALNFIAADNDFWENGGDSDVSIQ